MHRGGRRAGREGAGPGRVRIIGGQWGSRWLPVATLPGLRPSADAQRETVFNWLQGRIENARVLDLFAGTGAFGFEAASRGARSVTLVEKDPRAFRQLGASKQALGADTVTLCAMDVRRFLDAERAGGASNEPGIDELQPFDIVFLDPPFHQGWVPRVLERLRAYPWLRNTSSRVYVEQERGAAAPDPASWEIVRRRDCGEATGWLLQPVGSGFDQSPSPESLSPDGRRGPE